MPVRGVNLGPKSRSSGGCRIKAFDDGQDAGEVTPEEKAELKKIGE